MKIFLQIPGQPISKARPRFARFGKFVKTYSSQETEDGLWILTAREQIKKAGIFFSGLVAVTIIFWMKRPDSHYGTGKNSGALKSSAPKFPDTKKDIDNMIKTVFDNLNHCNIWVDDSKVISVIAKRRYSRVGVPSTDIEITDYIYD